MTNAKPPTASDQYAARIDAVLAQRLRLRGDRQGETWHEGPALDAFRADPHGPFDSALDLIASYLKPDDVLIDAPLPCPVVADRRVTGSLHRTARAFYTLATSGVSDSTPRVQPALTKAAAMTTLTPLPLATLCRTEARCWRATCAAVLVRVGQLRPSGVPVARFSGEWQEHERVWRISSYAKVMRQRTADRRASLVRRQRWTNPLAWKPVLAPLPCVAECPACGERQSITLTGLRSRKRGQHR